MVHRSAYSLSLRLPSIITARLLFQMSPFPALFKANHSRRQLCLDGVRVVVQPCKRKQDPTSWKTKLKRHCKKKQNTVTRGREETELIARRRHDLCAAPRVVQWLKQSLPWCSLIK